MYSSLYQRFLPYIGLFVVPVFTSLSIWILKHGYLNSIMRFSHLLLLLMICILLLISTYSTAVEYYHQTHRNQFISTVVVPVCILLTVVLCLYTISFVVWVA